MIGFSSNESIMTALWIFLGVTPIALGSLVAFALRIDPLSGRWREPAQPARKHAYNGGITACSESPSTGS
jgi:hypothetical protein